ncbi:hypothetical protein EF405_15875 [Cyclobacteriaceae bacterium YHN15]|nr:hypothetical protein EF405_15875 [Cyclobacteriaceae bacterium YHN15]
MKQNYLQKSIAAIWAIAFLLVAYSCSQIETFEPNMDSNDLAKDISKFKLTGPLVEPINWAMRGRPDGTPGQDKDPNGGNVECSELDMEYASSSGRNNYNDGEFENEWPEGLEVEVIDGEVCWIFTAPEGYCLASMAVIVKGGPAANVYEYTDGTSEDCGLVAPDNASGKPAGLSNLTFCWNLVAEPEAPELNEEVSSKCYGEEDGEVLSFDANDFVTVPDGVEIVWYDDETEGDVVEEPTLSEKGTSVTYWAEAVLFGGCVSSTRTPVTLELKDCDDGNGNGDDEIWCEQTGWTGSTAGPGNGWWFVFDTQGNETQPIYAGQKLTDGTMTYKDGKITIDLGETLRLQDVEDPVKAEGYDEETLPGSRPASGQFELYKGDELEFDGNGSRYYAVHLDVEVLTEGVCQINEDEDDD